MKRATVLGLTLILSSLARAALPDQWQSGGYHHEGYAVTTEPTERREGQAVLSIRSSDSVAADGEANAGTGFLADRYRGKRVRFSAFLRSADVAGWSGLWMRVGGPGARDGEPEKRLRFDNMRNRPVKGTTPWTRCAIVLDVPNAATDLALGFFLVGKGAVFMSAPKVEVVGDDVPVTSSTGKNLPLEPQMDLGRP